MGNVMDRKVSCSEARAASAPPQDQETMKPEKESEAQEIVPNLTFHLFSYRQQMGCKKHQMMKWATSKLLLTEELLKLQREHLGETTESWTDYGSYLTDEEDEENRAPAGAYDPLALELSNLKNYRLELRSTILEFAQEKMKKREKKKLKRLKRRTLISSKKPSNKNKIKYWHPQLESDEQMDPDPHDDPQDPQAEVIAID
ncbi:uncharacterized protein LOC108033508 [Drosophila biarmipes]|uniref:uncharacterized protein LOC108033508 n=1 Tax=Drosophila biarmipes TaxID=125945 RepID=UPI0007E79A1B|nr:uncharacterized protein LOC108033508 [Drosophila biarmipes]